MVPATIENLKVGDKVLLIKPRNLLEPPNWIEDKDLQDRGLPLDGNPIIGMDAQNGKLVTITYVEKHLKGIWFRIQEDNEEFWYNERWAYPSLTKREIDLVNLLR